MNLVLKMLKTVVGYWEVPTVPPLIIDHVFIEEASAKA
jgi:hypothetical protein